MSQTSPSLPPFPGDGAYMPPMVFVRRPEKRRYWLHALLFLLTLFTTTVVGARLQFNFVHDLPLFPLNETLFPLGWVLRQPRYLLTGLPFSITLLLILLAHEMGHFVYCVRHKVYATLPFFIPAPTLIGTLGAYIQVKSPFRSRWALFDIGIAGPIAGFLVAVPALGIGMWLSKAQAMAAEPSDLQLGYPFIFHLMWLLLPLSDAQGGSVALEAINFHPIAIAAWVGMFATALNLIPGGQLDGGHILYSLSPRAHRIASRACVALLLPLSIFAWTGWMIWAVVLLFFGARHPSVPEYPPLDYKRRMLFLFAVLMFLVCFSYQPITGASMLEFVRQTMHSGD